MGFSRQEYRSGLPIPSPGIFLTQGSNPHLLYLLRWQVGFFTTRTTWEPDYIPAVLFQSGSCDEARGLHRQKSRALEGFTVQLI